MRHAARAHAGARQARGRARAARAAAAARGAAADRPRLGDAPLPAPDGSGAIVVALDLRPHEAVVEHSDGRAQRDRADARPAGRQRSRGSCWRRSRELGGDGRDRPEAAGGPVERAARRGRGARALRPGAGRRLLRRGDPGRARARRFPRSLPRPLDAGQRVVGLVRPRRQPLLRRARRRRRPTTSSCATRWTPRRSPSAGGRATRVTARPRSTRTPIRRPRASRGDARRRAAARWEPALGEFVLDWEDVVRRARPARDRARVRPLGVPPRLRGVRVGSGAAGQRRGARRRRSAEP